MTNYLDAEVEHLLAAYHEAGHVMVVLEIERAGTGLLDDASIKEDSGFTGWFCGDDHPVSKELHTTLEVAGMAAGKVMLPHTEWWAGSAQDVSRAIKLSGDEGMKKVFNKTVREFKQPNQKAQLLAVAMLLLEKGHVYRDDVLDVLGE